MEDPKRTWPTDSSKKDSHELTEPNCKHGAYTRFIPGPLHMLQLLAWCFVTLLTVAIDVF